MLQISIDIFTMVRAFFKTNMKIDEALSMANILAAAAMGRDMDAEYLSTYTSMLQEKIWAASESFDQATSKNEKAA